MNEKESTHPNNIILWEDQKTRVCDFYACSDGDDKQYPDCKMRHERSSDCPLYRIHNLLDALNEGRD